MWLCAVLLFGPSVSSASVVPDARGVSTPCVVSPHAPSGRVELRVHASRSSRVTSTIDESRHMARVDTQASPKGDWILVDADDAKGWVETRLLICKAPPELARTIISEQASRAVRLLRQRDLRELSRLVHPTKGIRFSPYAFINSTLDVKFAASTLRFALESPRRYLWGTFDGTGDQIRLTFAEYYKRFVYDRDFAAASSIIFNNEPKMRGNTHDNSRDQYPSAIVVEYHKTHAEKDQEESDAASLRLIFEQHLGKWYLVHVAHDSWTI